MESLNLDQLRDGVAYADRWLACQQEFKDIPGVAIAIGVGDPVKNVIDLQVEDGATLRMVKAGGFA